MIEKNSSAQSRIGRVWSLIDAEILGAIKILKKVSPISKSIPDYETRLSKDFEIRVNFHLELNLK